MSRKSSKRGGAKKEQHISFRQKQLKSSFSTKPKKNYTKASTGKPDNATMTAKVIKAFENPDYKWRTVLGVSKETGLKPEQVMQIIQNNKASIAKASITSKKGYALYTTRKHFRKKATTYERLIGAIRNRLY